MKKYLLFAHNQYYPSGGWHDFEGAFDTADEAFEKGKALDRDDYQVVNLELLEEIEETK